jgi:prepilin-type N-terminal cleavage/methylation domain-containing protein
MLRRTEGFTVIELIITVVIIGILAAVGYPAYTRFIRDGQVEVARAVINALVAAEKMARERNGTCVAGTPAGWVSINVGNGIYTVDTEQIDTGEAPNFEFLISNVDTDTCTVTARGIAGGFDNTDTLICTYDATDNPRQTWSGTLND